MASPAGQRLHQGNLVGVDDANLEITDHLAVDENLHVSAEAILFVHYPKPKTGKLTIEIEQHRMQRVTLGNHSTLLIGVRAQRGWNSNVHDRIQPGAAG